MSKARAYGLINIIVLALFLSLFLVQYRSVIPEFLALAPGRFLMLGLCALVVNCIKLLRLYFILYGNGKGLSLWEHTRQYCKVLPVSMVLPFKTGDLFRAFCYGYHLDSYGAGLVYILLDRFIDTCALVTIVLAAGSIYGVQGGWVFYLLLVFVGAVLLCYTAFPGICQYWRRLFLTHSASRRGLSALRTLSLIDDLYQKISGVIRGRGLVLYLFSLAAWLAEIGGMLLLSSGSQDQVSLYLEAALTGAEYPLLQQFVLTSTLLLLGLYGLLYLVGWRKKHENCNHL